VAAAPGATRTRGCARPIRRAAARTPNPPRRRHAGYARRVAARACRIASLGLVAPIDDGHAVHYTAVPRGVPVYGSDELEVGKVIEVLDNYREHIMDGVVFQTPDGMRRFVDAPEVARTAERGVTLTIPAAEAALLPPPESAPRVGGAVKRLFGGLRRR
jgi:hypothetical protein